MQKKKKQGLKEKDQENDEDKRIPGQAEEEDEEEKAKDSREPRLGLMSFHPCANNLT